MPREVINPDSLYDSVQYGFSHATRSSGGMLVHCAGQVAWDKEYNVVGAGDLGAQARQALKNIEIVLAEAGATKADIVRMRTYVVNHTPDKLEPVGAALGEFWGDVVPAANTWIGVQALAMPDFLIEIEVTAQVG
jgi:enamine deaminase RidA (YjgF/YER057c/UK114 family)